MTLYGDILSLESWRIANGIDPYHFWGWSCEPSCGDCSAHKRNCGRLWYSHFWQRNTVSRGDVRNAINEARNLIHSHFDSYIGVEYLEEEIDLPWNLNRVLGCDFTALQLCQNHVQAVGVQCLEQLNGGTALAVEYLDETGATHDFATATVPPCWFRIVLSDTSTISLDELQAFFVDADLPLNAKGISSDSYVANIKWTHDSGAGTYTGIGQPWLLARPILYEKQNCCGLDCLEETNYTAELNLYRVYHDPAGTTAEKAAVTLFRADIPCSCYDCCTDFEARISTGSVKKNTKAGMIIIHDLRYDTDTATFVKTCCDCGCRPNRATVRYAAGLDSDKCVKVEPILHMLATGLLPSMCDDCARGDEKLFQKWTRDYTYEDPNAPLNTPFALNDNPFGMTEGAARAYQRLLKMSGLRIPRATVM